MSKLGTDGTKNKILQSWNSKDKIRKKLYLCMRLG